MKCVFCKGEREESTSSDFNDLGKRIIIVKDVPCYKCVQCGEVTFKFSTGERIDEIIDTLKDSLTGDIVVVRYSMTEVSVVQYAETVAA